MIVRPLLVNALAHNDLSYKTALGPLSMNYTLWEDTVVRGVLSVPRLPIDRQFFGIGCIQDEDFANSWEEPGSRK
jgi:hypothetical protein